MSQFIELPSFKADQPQEHPFYYNAEGVTAVCQVTTSYLKAVNIFGAEGKPFSREEVTNESAAQEIVAAIETAQGRKFHALPCREDDGTVRSTYYIDPAAVAFLTVSAESKGAYGVIVGVKGVGRVETYQMTAPELNDLLDAVRGQGKTLLEMTPDEAHARWANASKLYIDPTTVTRIHQDGGQQLWVYFKDAGSLDVQPGPVDTQKMYKDLIAEQPELKNDFDAVCFRIDAGKSKEINKMLADLAAKLASGNPDLRHIPCSEHASYVQMSDLSRVYPQETRGGRYSSIVLEFKPVGTQIYPDTAHLNFLSAADRDQTLNMILQGSTSKPKPGAAPKI